MGKGQAAAGLSEVLAAAFLAGAAAFFAGAAAFFAGAAAFFAGAAAFFAGAAAFFAGAAAFFAGAAAFFAGAAAFFAGAAAFFAGAAAFFAGAAAFFAGAAAFFAGAAAFLAGAAAFLAAGAAALTAAFFAGAAFGAGSAFVAAAFFAAAFLAAGAFFAVAITISWIKLQRAPRRVLQRSDSPPEGPSGLLRPARGRTHAVNGWTHGRGDQRPVRTHRTGARRAYLEVLAQSHDRAPPVWYSMTRVSKKLRSFFRSIISLIQGKGFSSFGNNASRPICIARRFAM